MRTLLIDADVLVYEACRANEVETKWEDDLWTLHAFFDPTREQFDAAVQEIKEKLEADAVVMALSDYEKPWRKEIMPTYKGNRRDVRKPITYAPMRAYCHEKYDTFQRPGLEGDDILGILLTNPKLYPGEKIVVSIDKDMKTLPGLHANLTQLRGGAFPEVLTVTPEDANKYHMTQTLTGDSVDGYPGCPGIGPVKAARLLNNLTRYSEMWPVVVNAYESAGLSQEVALSNARVARICRHGDYDYTNKSVRLWTPK